MTQQRPAGRCCVIAPKANAEWWKAKLDLNEARDRTTNARLIEFG